jgi:ABC-type methionine transport system ATPase subunit
VGGVTDLATQAGSRLNRTLFPQPVSDVPAPGFGRVVLTFNAATSEQPILSALVRDFGLDLNLAGGSLEEIGGERVGQLHLDLRGDRLDEALTHLRSLSVGVERGRVQA